MSDSWLQILIAKHSASGILVDSNLLFLWSVGTLDPSLVEREKGTRNYTLNDFRLLAQLLAQFKRFVTTPNILTEVSNLSERLQQHIRPIFRQLIRDKFLEILDERFVTSEEAVNHDIYERLGLTDAVIGLLADQGPLVVTNDLDLSLLLESRQVDVIHYDRTLRPLALNMD
ncbi:MAG: hypothetical protein WD468_09980 [Pirellulales bacterium]